MFKKTINELKDLTEIDCEVVVKVDNETRKEVVKSIIKTVAIVTAINVVGHTLIAVIDGIVERAESEED